MPYDVDITSDDDVALIALRAAPTGLRAVAATLGLTLPQPNTVTTAARLRAFAIARDEWLLAVPDTEELQWFEKLDGALAGGDGAVAVVTDAYVRTRITGPDTRHVITQAVPIDLDPSAFPPGSARRTAFGRASALVHYLVEPHGFDVYADRTLARYTTRLLHACSARTPL